MPLLAESGHPLFQKDHKRFWWPDAESAARRAEIHRKEWCDMKSATRVACSLMAIVLGTTAVEVKGGPGNTGPITSHLLIPADPLNPSLPAAAPVIFSDIAVSGSDTYVNGLANVTSIFQPGGDWDLDTTTSTTRAIWLNLADPSVPFNAQYVPSWMITHCVQNGLTPVSALMGIGSSTTCPMTFRINWGSDSSVFYRIEFNSIVHPGTGDIKFTCTAVTSNNSCVGWSGGPAGDASTPGDGRSNGRLVKITSTRRTETETFIGYYNVIFQMAITKP
jgi:hypothetical protein